MSRRWLPRGGEVRVPGGGGDGCSSGGGSGYWNNERTKFGSVCMHCYRCQRVKPPESPGLVNVTGEKQGKSSLRSSALDGVLIVCTTRRTRSGESVE